MTLLLDALKASQCDGLQEKMKLLMNTYISARQMGEVEALYKIFPDFHLKDSNVTTVFVPVSKKKDRSKFLLKVDNSMNYNGQEKIVIEGREGFYVEHYDSISKYERREKGLENLSFSQFSKMYTSSWNYVENNQTRGDVYFEDNDTNEYESKFDFVMQCENDSSDLEHELCKMKKGKRFPNYIKLKSVYPGEAPFMKKRVNPVVLGLHKIKQNTQPREYFYAKLLLYKPFDS